jgi:hypothetical protein
MTDLELLRRLEQSLNDPDVPYRFSHWNSCTCGHIYLAATGKMATNHLSCQPNNNEYRVAVVQVAQALGFDSGSWMDAEEYVSRATSRAARGDNRRMRGAALCIVREAIVKLEAKYEAAAHNFGIK